MKPQQEKTKKETTKITVGTDEFCSNCMEWREYNNDGKCKVCGKLIKKTIQHTRKINYDEYEIDNVFDASENEEDNYSL